MTSNARFAGLQNYYFKDSVAYTEDHIPVQKIYIFGLPLQVCQSICCFGSINPLSSSLCARWQLNYKNLQAHFGMYGRVLRLQLFRPKKVPRRQRRVLQTGYVFYAQKTDAAKALHSRVHHLNGLKFHVRASDSWHQPEACEMPREPPVCPPSTGPPPPIMSLNDHCLEYVLAYLPLPDQVHFARTCPRFRAVYQMATARLHKSVNVTDFDKMTLWDMRDFFWLSGAHVENVYGIMANNHSQRLCDYLAESCRNVKSMNVLSHIWSGHNMHKVFARKNLLETVELPMSNISDRSVLALRNVRKLKALNLSNNPLIGDTIAKLPCTIESLTLDDCPYLEVKFLIKTLKTFHWLKELNIKGLDPHGVQIYEIFVKDKCCMCLETLRITGYSHIHYEFVAQIPNLKHLTVSVKGGVREELFEQLAKHKAQQLECLWITGNVTITKEMLLNIVNLSELRVLTLPRIPSAALVDAFGSCNLLKLEEFILRDCYGCSDQAILKVFGACRRLKLIGLGYCTALNDELVMGIVSRVQQEIANKDMHRKLPIELCLFLAVDLDKKIEEVSAKLPKNIIKIKHSYDPDGFMRDYFGGGLDDYSFDPDDLDYEDDLEDLEDTDDDEFEDEMYRDIMGFLSGDDEDDDDDDLFLGAAGGYVHPSWPYDSNGD
ncbi:hypothetical protein KR054_011771, partial [Drosophila jambulina]